MNIALSFNRAVSLWSERQGLVDGDKRFTYAQFGARVNSLAAYLAAKGLVKGDIAAVLAPNGHEIMEIYYACAISGIVLNPINYRLSSSEISIILKDSGCKLIFAHSDFHECINKSAQDCSSVERLCWFGKQSGFETNLPVDAYESSIERNAGSTFTQPIVTSDDLAQLYYTSGTTGKAKGVMLTHENVCSNALGAVTEIQLRESDVWAHVGPMFHLADAWSIFAVTWAGGSHTFIPYFDATKALNVFESESVTVTAMVPTMVNAIFSEKDVKTRDYSSLRLIMTAGSPVAPEQVKRIISDFKCDYIQFYGMTETSPFLTIGTLTEELRKLPEADLLKLKSRTGRQFIAAEVKVVREDGVEVKPDDKEVGEIIARGPVVMKGYWKQPETTAQTIKDGWIHTGDLAVIDRYGFINIVDRQKDMIISGGENIYSTEVEYALYEHDSVQECAVFGIPDERWGEKVKAVIVLKSGKTATEEELIEFVRGKLARYKAPRSIEFVAELPKTGSGKIYKRGLRETHWNDKERKV